MNHRSGMSPGHTLRSLTVSNKTASSFRSIKRILSECQHFEKGLGLDVSVISSSLERDLRNQFEREARASLYGITFTNSDLSAKLEEADNVETMREILFKACNANPENQRRNEHLERIRFDTEKLFGAFYIGDVVSYLGMDQTKWAERIQAALEKKGLCLSTSSDGYTQDNFGYAQKDALYALGMLLDFIGAAPTRLTSELWMVLGEKRAAGFDHYFASKTTIYKNGSIVIKGLGAAKLAYISQLLARKYQAWKKQN